MHSFAPCAYPVQHPAQHIVQLLALAGRGALESATGDGVAVADHAFAQGLALRRQFEPQRTAIVRIRHPLQVAALLQLVQQPGERAGVVMQRTRQLDRRHRFLVPEQLERDELREVEFDALAPHLLLDRVDKLRAQPADQPAQLEGAIGGGFSAIHAEDDTVPALIVKAIISKASMHYAGVPPVSGQKQTTRKHDMKGLRCGFGVLACLIACGPVWAAGFDLAAGPSITSSARTTSAVFASM